MVKKAAAVYCLLMGASMIAMWTLLLMSGSVPELKTEPLRISLHLLSEFLTVGVLLTAGLGLLLKKPWAEKTFFLAMGALMYSVLTAGGYYLQLGDYTMPVMFAAIFLSALFFVLAVGKRRTP
jgi:hypothetical protein